MAFSQLTLVLGGAASGKSRWGETHVMNSGLPRYYIATAQAWDDEMRDKVAKHKAQRGADWTTIEAPLTANDALASIPDEAVVLLDCATLWLTNQILAETDIDAAENELLSALATCKSPVVVISNEVGAGIVPDNALSRRFRNAQGQLNQRLAEQADTVIAVMAGLPLALKGEMPE